MARGSCTCGQYTYEVPSSPESVIICHCLPCRKFAGLNGSVNALVADNEYKILTGTTRTFDRVGDSGKNVRNHYCADCNTLVYVEIDAMPGQIVYKPGTLDETPEGAKPAAEIYTRNRPGCFSALKDVHQTEGGS